MTLKTKSEARSLCAENLSSLLAQESKENLDRELTSNLHDLVEQLKPSESNGGFIASFNSLRHEPKIDLSEKLKVAFPVVNTDHSLGYFFPLDSPSILSKSNWGVLEPDLQAGKWQSVNPSEVAMVLVPAFGFTDQGYRLGHGKGCYDRFLSEVKENTTKLGVGYSAQVGPQDWIEDEHDIKLDFIVTEKFIIKVN